MKILSAIGLALAAVSTVFGAYRQLQMLQQNSYFPSRYAKWLRQSFRREMAAETVLWIVSVLLWWLKAGLWLLIIWVMVTAVRVPSAFRIHRKAIKPLVFTARVKRQYAILAVVEILLTVGSILLYDRAIGALPAGILFLLSSWIPVAVLCVWILAFPLEKAVTGHFIREAKRKLQSYAGLKVIGVTGSYGKTTTKFILQRLLSEKYNVVATPQSFNTPMGVVRTIREHLTPSTQIFICEMGAKNVGDIKEICDIVHPDMGLITSVGAQHLETFRTVDNVFQTKFELADAVRQKGGITFVNGSSEELKKRLNDRPNCAVYGLDERLEYYAEDIQYGRNGSSFTLVLRDKRIAVSTKLLGLHSVMNIVAAAAVADALGVTEKDIQYAVSSLKPTEHRLELKPFRNRSLMIDDAYNANPEGSLEAVRVLGSFDGMYKIIVTPGLIELGEREYDCNYRLGLAAAEYCDRIVLVGKNRSKPLHEAVASTAFDREKLTVAASFAEAMQQISAELNENCVVLLENDLPDNYLN